MTLSAVACSFLGSSCGSLFIRIFGDTLCCLGNGDFPSSDSTLVLLPEKDCKWATETDGAEEASSTEEIFPAEFTVSLLRAGVLLAVTVTPCWVPVT